MRSAHTCTTFLVFSLLVAILLCLQLSSSSTVPPTNRNTLVILQDEQLIQKTHSAFFQNLKDQGQKLTFKSVSDSDAQLEIYGEFIYDSLIIFATTSEKLGGLKTDSILRFIDAGHNVLVATDESASEALRSLAAECGIELADRDAATVVDHFSFDSAADGGQHDVVVVEAIERHVADVHAPLLFKGAGMYLRKTNPLTFALASGSATALTSNPADIVTSDAKPTAVGSATVLVAALQGRNNARVVVSGSIQLFSNKFFTSPVQKYTEDNSSKRFERSGNEKFATEISMWALQERHVIRIENPSHFKINGSTRAGYRIKDFIDFSFKAQEWNGQEWTPFSSASFQLSFTMLDPHIRVAVPSTTTPGDYHLQFQSPDVYGVFKLNLRHFGRGYSRVDWAENVIVRPFRHDEYERFIPAAFPYYASAFSMMAGFFVFAFLFLYHRDGAAARAGGKKAKAE